MAKKYRPSLFFYISILMRAKNLANLWSDMNGDVPAIVKYKGHTLYVKNNRCVVSRKVSSGNVYVGGFCTEEKCPFPGLICEKCMLNTKLR